MLEVSDWLKFPATLPHSNSSILFLPTTLPSSNSKTICPPVYRTQSTNCDLCWKQSFSAAFVTFLFVRFAPPRHETLTTLRVLPAFAASSWHASNTRRTKRHRVFDGLEWRLTCSSLMLFSERFFVAGADRSTRTSKQGHNMVHECARVEFAAFLASSKLSCLPMDYSFE